jgi:ABC-type microcin C transport system duplicated ATPase subunit YejF
MKRLVNQFLSTVEIAVQRTWTALGSHAAIALGVLVATTTICALLLYAEVDLFRSLARRYGVTVVIVSHDAGLAQHVDRTVAIYDGRLIQLRGGEP